MTQAGLATTYITVKGSGFGKDQGSGRVILKALDATADWVTSKKYDFNNDHGLTQADIDLLVSKYGADVELEVTVGVDKVKVNKAFDVNGDGKIDDKDAKVVTDYLKLHPLSHDVGFVNETQAGCSWSDTEVVAKLPAPLIKAERWEVHVKTAAGASPETPVFTVSKTIHPAICLLNPAAGGAGDRISISGANFGDTKSQVTFAGLSGVRLTVLAADIASWSNSLISLKVPSSIITGDTKVAVTFPAQYGGQQESNPVTFKVAPFITSLTPATAPAGAWVTIRGGNFGATAGTVTFVGAANTRLVSDNLPGFCQRVWTDKQIVVKVPAAGLTGFVKVRTAAPPDLETTETTSKVFTYDASLPLPPGLCELQPAEGVPPLEVALKGDNFGTGAAAQNFVQFSNNSLPSKSAVGLVGDWKMDEINWNNDCSTKTVIDLSSSHNSGKSCPASTGPTGSANGKFGQAGNFDGTDDYVDLADGLADFSGGFTVSVWAYPTAVKWWSRFIDFGNGAANNNILFTRNAATNDLTFEVYGPAGEGSGGKITAPGAIDLNQWQYFVATMDTSGKVKIYKNGLEVASGASTKPITNVTRTNNYFGRSNWGVDEYFAGQLDEMRIYSRALSPQEVSSLYVDWSNQQIKLIAPPNTTSGQVYVQRARQVQTGTTCSGIRLAGICAGTEQPVYSTVLAVSNPLDFIASTIKPKVASVVPAKDATNICRNAEISITFASQLQAVPFSSEEMVVNNVCPEIVYHNSGRALLGKLYQTLASFWGQAAQAVAEACEEKSVAGSLRLNQDKVLFVPATPLDADTKYEVSLPSDKVDCALLGGCSWAFTTGSEICQINKVEVTPASYNFS
ncbi:MAG: IPT/TIG domain-containing protein, partial [Candidatus Kerfeldbacteria bacterium]|nr:IPT/TIG domain-containing protein [Candidatus Kerfeldbacteria bacterium]